MSEVTEAFLAKLMEVVDPLDVMRKYVTPATLCLHVGHCPFGCSGRLFLHDKTKRWFCDLCRRAGDIVDLVATVKSLSREDAVQQLALEWLEDVTREPEWEYEYE